VTIVAAGDIACDATDPEFNGGNGSGAWCRAQATEALIRHLKPTAVLPLGDEQYLNGALAKFRQSYALSWGGQLSITRPATGNHEYETPGGAGYYSYFGARAGPGRRGWCGYTLGGCLNGHDHLYERFKPLTPSGVVNRSRGICEFIVGTGGAQHYAVVNVHKGSAVRNADTFGVLQITLGAGTYQWRFVHVVGATFTDTGTGTCH
jgi:hypothetical protein